MDEQATQPEMVSATSDATSPSLGVSKETSQGQSTEPPATRIGTFPNASLSGNINSPEQAPAPKVVPAEVARADVLTNPEPIIVAEMAQTPAFEPFNPESPAAAIVSSLPETVAVKTESVAPTEATKATLALLLRKAGFAIQTKKQNKLSAIMTLFENKNSITNDDVEGLFDISNATATRYLAQLEQIGKIKQIGKIGRGVSYVRV